jgi:hypothetical protein
MHLRRLKSQQATTPYAPSWDVPLGIAQWSEHDKIDTIRDFLLEKEEEILRLPYQGDGNTGLDETNITTRYGNYHLFDFTEECSELNDLLEWLREQWVRFIIEDNTQPYILAFTCWYNIIRKGQEIKPHRHGAGSIVYLSGNMHLDNYETSTQYEHMGMTATLPNVKGGLTLFPGYVHHGVLVYNGDTPRVSLAFDISINEPPVHPLQKGLKYRSFADIEMCEKITKDLTNE